jgi:tetratricopeptide (TPR) repeat protein
VPFEESNMLRRAVCSVILAVLMTMILLSCASVTFDRNVQQRTEDVLKNKQNLIKYVNRVLKNLRDTQAIREVGIISLKFGKYDKARLFLKRAGSLDPHDPRAQFYLGLTLEFNDQEKEAMDVYRNYPGIPLLSPYKRLMEARHYWLMQKSAREEIKALLQQEENLGLDSLSLDALAVFPLQYHGNNSEYSSLGRGLCEMMITDLSQVKELTLVERVRINALLEEMAVGQSGLVDGDTAPKFGKLLRSHRIISGGYDVVGKNLLKMDVNFWDFPNREPTSTQSKEKPLRDVLKVEKQVVVDLITDLGIYLTKQDREKILQVPTKNLQAFMAFCRGLEKQDEGNYGAAVKEFQTAVILDPGFQSAVSKLNENIGLMGVGTDKDRVLASMTKLEMPVPPALSAENLTALRLQQTANIIGSNFIPGQENRKAPEEAVTAGSSSGFGDLPDPPPAPVGR